MIKTVGLVGAGSVGGALMFEMSQSGDENLYLLAKGNRAARFNNEGLCVNNTVIRPKVYSSAEQNIHIDVLIISVKTYSLETVMEDIADLIDDDTILLPIQNGILTTDILRERFPNNRVFYGIVLRTDAHRMGRHVFYTTLGEMQIGYADNTVIAPEVQEVYDKLKGLGVNIKIYEDMRRAQWRKWMLNTGASQTAVEVQSECGYFGQVEEIPELMGLLMDEIIALAEVENVNITEKDRDEIIEMLINFPPNKKMSMLQDYEAGREIEIDEYAGTVIKLGKKHGIPTPANRVLYLAITAREKVEKLRKG